MRRRLLLVAAVLLGSPACGDDNSSHPDAPIVDAGPDAPPDAPTNTEVTCETLPPATSGTCDVVAGSAAKLIKGEVLTPGTLYHGGQVAVDATGQITCVGCDCAAGGETVITCADGAISPGLINTHDHITFTQNQPYTDDGTRYDDRQQWRKGLDGKPKITSAGSATADQIRWGELRFLMGGATSIVGSGGQAGLLRNLDSANQEGLGQKAVDFDTFPLDDSGGTRRSSDCNYGGMPTTSTHLDSLDAYEPHTSEGVDTTAHNEFLCESSATYDAAAPGTSNNLLNSKTAMIHAIGLQPADYAAMAQAGTGLIWSPRSNITLYGDTARVAEAAKLGVEIALGTDWMPSGSMNLLRELACADSFNQKYLAGAINDVSLWKMVTLNAASVTATDDVIGLLAPGKVADISIFTRHGKPGYRSVIEAEPKDVALVMRGGKVLYGDDGAVTASGATACDAVDVCGVGKRVCLMSEVGKSYDALKTAVGTGMYPAFACGQPMNEPSCTPKRPTATAGSTVFTGDITATDMDGDGIENTADNCPTLFNPARPMDNGMQGDADGDGAGDACDPCPLDANTSTCTTADPNDRDHDTVPNATDNCPDNANTDQADADADGHGDVCDACPMDANPGSAGCASTIYKIKSGMTPVGSSVHLVNVLVTGKGSNGFFVQAKLGDAGYMGVDNSGLFVFMSTSPLLATVNVGARVTIDGNVAVFQGQTELDTVTAITVVAAGPEALPVPEPATYDQVKTGGTKALLWESVIIALPAASVTAVDTTFGEFTLKDSAGASTLQADDFLYVPMPAVTVGQSFSAVKGILTLRQSMSKLEPRNAGDLTQGSPGIATFGPALSYARLGVTTASPTFPTALTITLSGPSQGTTTVMLMAGAGLSVPTSVSIPDGMTSVTVPVTATAASMTPVTVTAMLGVQMMTATVRVLGTTEAPATVVLSPNDTAVAPNGTVQFTVTLDVPALTPATINLTSTSGGTVPTSVTVPINQTTATFTYTDAGATAPTTVTASLQGTSSTSTAMVTVNTGVNHLVINEVDYDQTATDNAEFIEIYNPSAVAQSLTGKQVLLVNGSNNAIYATIDLTGSLASHAYLVIGGPNVTVGTGVTKLDPGWTTDKVQNGAPDGIALIDNTAHTLIDALSYEGAITAVTVPGFTGQISLVEGTALADTVADPGTGNGSLCRSPNGQDTDNAATDWVLCATQNPGQPNP